MQADAQTINTVKSLLTQTLDPNRQTRKNAEEQLRSVENKAGFSILLLKILEAPAASPGDVAVQQSSAVFFKNYLKKSWGQGGEQKENGMIPAGDRNAIKTHIVSLMCNVSPTLQRQLVEVVRIVGEHDFPEKWQNLMPDIVGRLDSAADFRVINGLLETCNTLFKMFRDKPASDPLWLKLKYVLEQFQVPLLKLYTKMSAMVDTNAQNPAVLKDVFSSLRLLTRIFYSLNWQTIPEYFEDNMNPWMKEFHKFLQYENPALVDNSEEEVPGPIEALQSAVLANLKLYADKYEEEFQQYLEQFTQDAWNLLLKTGPLSKYDDLVTIAMKFLSSLVGKSMHKPLFSKPGVLQSICEKIVIPNLMLREWDQENFEDNPIDYIRGDMEGSDKDSRRKTACDLIRSMCKIFETEATQTCLGFMKQMLDQYQRDPLNQWRSKDAAITLMIAIAVKGYTFNNGASEINTQINVVDFYNQFVVSELTQADVDGQPVMKADALKFLTTFRRQLPKEAIVGVIGPTVQLLKARSYVVHTYAAIAIDRIFALRDTDPNNAKVSQFRYNITQLEPFLDPVFTNLFHILESASQTENEYVMKAVMRVIVTAKSKLTAVTGIVIDKLTVILGRVCANPQNPVFNHFLFESLAALVQFVCQANPGAVSEFESRLFPPFQQVLAQEVTELTPYVFQIMAQMLELGPGAPSQGYMSLFQALLHPALWENRGNAPVLVRLIEAYFRKGASTIIDADRKRVEGLLGVFQKLIASASTEEYAFRLLISLVEFLPPEYYAQYLDTVFKLIFTKLQNTKSSQFAKSLVIFLAVFIGKHGPGPSVNAIETLGNGLFWQIIRQVWIPTVLKIKKPMDKKACAIAMTRIVVETPDALGTHRATAQQLVVGVLSLYETQGIDDSNVQSPEELLSAMAETGYTSSYSRLAYAETEVRDSFKDIEDARIYFVQNLYKYSVSNKGVTGPFVEEALKSAPNGQMLMDAFRKYLANSKVGQLH